jgi:hypothetical protein
VDPALLLPDADPVLPPADPPPAAEEPADAETLEEVLIITFIL